jgi:hypothetical protein
MHAAAERVDLDQIWWAVEPLALFPQARSPGV